MCFVYVQVLCLASCGLHLYLNCDVGCLVFFENAWRFLQWACKYMGVATRVCLFAVHCCFVFAAMVSCVATRVCLFAVHCCFVFAAIISC